MQKVDVLTAVPLNGMGWVGRVGVHLLTAVSFFPFQITALNSEVNQLIEQRMRSGDPTEDKLSLFRQQVLVHPLGRGY